MRLSRRFFFTWLWRILLFLLLGIALLSVIGAIYQRAATRRDAQQYPPPGQMVEVEGTLMHLYCLGEGTPTVILESGLGGNYLDWALVQPEVARVTQVCAYDRAGMGYSAPVGRGLTSAEVAARLHTLLQTAGIPGPYLLVGHSYGGIQLRTFAQTYPAETAGLVLVDSSHENQAQRLPGINGVGPRLMQAFIATTPFLARVGLLRFARVADRVIPGIEKLGTERPRHAALVYRASYWRAYVQDSKMAGRETNQAVPPASLGDLPLVVLTQGSSEAGNPEMQPFWHELQQELAALSTRSRQLVVEDAGHYIHWDRPDVVIDQILALVAEIRGE